MNLNIFINITFFIIFIYLFHMLIKIKLIKSNSIKNIIKYEKKLLYY